MSSELCLQALFSALTNGSIYALVGLGFTITWLATRLVNIAQGEFVMLAGVVFASLARFSSIPIPLMLLFSISVVIIVAILLERILIHPLIATSSWQEPRAFLLVLITTSGMMFIEGVTLLIWGPSFFSPPLLCGYKPVNILGASIHPQCILTVSMSFLMLVLIAAFFKFTSHGRAMKACAENPIVSNMLGINARFVATIAFALSGMIGAMGGLLITPITQVDYMTGRNFMIRGVFAALFGGMEKVAGPIIGGYALGLLEGFFGLVLPGKSGAMFRNAAALIVAIIIFALRPSGILGESKWSRK